MKHLLKKCTTVISFLCVSLVSYAWFDANVENTNRCDQIKVSWSGASDLESTRRLDIRINSGQTYTYYVSEFPIPSGSKLFNIDPTKFPQTVTVTAYSDNGETQFGYKTLTFNNFTIAEVLELDFDQCTQKLSITGEFNQPIKGISGSEVQEYVRFTISDNKGNSESVEAAGNNKTAVSAVFETMPYDKEATYTCTAIVLNKQKIPLSTCAEYSKTFAKANDEYKLSKPTVVVVGEAIEVGFDSQNACAAVAVNLYRCTDGTETLVPGFNYAEASGKFTDNGVEKCKVYSYYLKAENLTYGSQKSEHSEAIAVANDDVPLEITNFTATKGDYADKVVVSWNLSRTTDVQFINVYRSISTNPAAFTQIAHLTSASSQMTYVDNTTILGAFYLYRIEVKTLQCRYVSKISGGCSTAVASVTGRVTYIGDNATPGVLVEARLADESAKFVTQGSFYGGAGIVGSVEMTDALDCSAFSWQAWLHPNVLDRRQFQNSVIYRQVGAFALKLDNQQHLVVTNDNGTEYLNYDVSGLPEFFHVSITKKDSIRLYINGEKVASAKWSGANGLQSSQIFMANQSLDDLGNAFEGYIDDMRLWSKELSADEIFNNYLTLLSGEEENLVGYWKFDERGLTMFIDYCFHRAVGNKRNHGKINGFGTHREVSPPQLRFFAYTDTKGNYKIVGIPFESNGTTYRIVPVKEGNTFSPDEKIVMFDRFNALVQNVDFVDNSAYDVYVRVKYHNTQVPATGIQFMIDDMMAYSDSDGAIETDSEGFAKLSVPIGTHTIKATKSGHTFSQKIGIGGGTITQTFHAAIEKAYALEFTDSTLVRVAGKIVGGSTESEKTLGFGKSKNNLGVTAIDFRLKGDAAVYALTASGENDTTVLNKTRLKEQRGNIQFEDPNPQFTTEITSKKEGSRWLVSVKPDPQSGEYMVDLLPETYEVVRINHYTQPGGVTFGTFEDIVATKDTLTGAVSVNSDSIAVYRGDGSLDKMLYYEDTLKVDMHRNFVLFAKPKVVVKQIDRTSNAAVDYFGEKTLGYPLFASVPAETLTMYDEGTKTYTLNNTPVFLQNESYHLRATVSDTYFASGNDSTSYPFTNGKLFVSGTIGNANINTDLTAEPMDIYILPGEPNLNGNNKKYLSIYVQTDGESYYWNTQIGSETPNQLGAYVFGSVADPASQFVTKGPDMILTVLRDPPGNNSYATMLEGSTIANSYSVKDRRGETDENQRLVVKYATGFRYSQGYGAGIAVFELSLDAFKSEIIGSFTEETEYYHFGTNETYCETKFTKSFSTPSGKEYVGSEGDLFVGKSTNLIFSEARVLALTKDATSGNIGLNQYNTLAYGDSIGTTFYYTKKHIEQTLIPKLQKRAEELLEYSPNPDVKPAASEFAEGVNAIYRTQYKPGDPKYCTKGSYKFYPNQNVNKAFDEVLMSIENIRIWKERLKEDENLKLKAIAGNPNWESENISFDAGNTLNFSKEIVNDTVKSTIRGYECYMYANLSAKSQLWSAVLEVEEKGGWAYKQDNIDHNEITTTNQNSTIQKIEYTLADDCVGNYYSVNVYTDTKDVNTPIYQVVGGRTACPNFAGEMTKYQTGTQKVLHAVTEQSENPQILVNNLKYAPFLNLEPTQEVRIPLQISEKSADAAGSVYGVKVLNDNRIDGLKVRLEIYQNEVQLNGNKPTTINAYIEQGRKDVSEYDSVGFVVYSLCQYPPMYYGSRYIADTCYVKLSFKPYAPVSQVTLKQESNIINTECDSAKIRIDGFDLNYLRLADVAVEYRNEGSLKWDTKHYFAFTPEEFTQQKQTYSSIDSVTQEIKSQQYLDYLFRFSDSDVDGTYQVRARADIKHNNIVLDTRYSEPITIVKDKTIPMVTAVSPANGILDLGDQVSLTFNENMYPSRQLSDFISIKGVLNGKIDETGNDRALKFNGKDMFAQTEFNYNLSGKSFTIEGWIYPENTGNESVIFSQGRGNTSFTVGIDAAGKLFVEVQPENRRQTLEWSLFFDRWSHIAVVCNYETNQVRVLVDNLVEINRLDAENYLQFDMPLSAEYKGVGAVTFGKNGDDTKFFAGLMRDFRLWERAFTSAQIAHYRRRILSGDEVALVGYWKMDELNGAVAHDHARSHNLAVNADWHIYPGGYGIATNNSAFALVSNPALNSEQDFTLEFWFKGETPAEQATLLAKFGDNAAAADEFSIYAMPTNALKMNVLGKTYDLDVPCFDNRWHHFAMAVNRVGNANIYLDGQLAHFLLGSEMATLDDKFSLGATYSQNETDSLVSQQFTGNFDNLRIWNYALSQKNINNQMHERTATGTAGLVANYPFDKMDEAHGNTDVMPYFYSLADDSGIETGRVSIYQIDGETISQTNDSLLILRNEAALVAYHSNRERILPAYINQPNGLILSLEEFDTKPYRLQNAELTATVSNMRDLHGNYMKPKEWSFVVNNQHLLWQSEPLKMRKAFGEKLTFDVTFTNRSGKTENFAIENLPLWLTASETIGSIAPLKSRTITFEVAESQPVGSYEEMIYLVGEGELTDKLELTMTVFKQQPDWQPQFADDAAMNVIGQVSVNGYFSNNSEDLLAAFAGDSCVGVASPSEKDGFYWLTIATPTVEKPLNFKFWSADEGVIYSNLKTSPRIGFKSRDLVGSPSNPVLFEVTDDIEQQIDLQSGWTWISTNVTPENPAVSSIFANHIPNVSTVKTKGGWASYDSNFGGWVNDFAVHSQLMYMVNAADYDRVSILGKAIDAKTDSILLRNSGGVSWNWIGYPAQDAMAVTDALSLLDAYDGELIKGQNGFAIFDSKRGWMGTLAMLEPGHGYQFRTLAQRSFVYPAKSPMRKAKAKMVKAAAADENSHFSVDIYKFPSSMNLFALVDKYDIQAADELGIFCGDECRGVGTTLFDSARNRYLFAVQIYGEIDGDLLSFRLYKAASDSEERFADQMKFTTNAVLGTPSAPILLNTQTALENVAIVTILVTPNPVVDNVQIVSEQPLKSVRIVDAVGRVLLENRSGQAVYNLSALTAGCYFIEIETPQGKQIETIIKQ